LGRAPFRPLLAAAGDAQIKDQRMNGTGPGGMSHKVHLDGYNQLPYLTGQEAHSPRHEFFYFNDDGQLVAMRYDNWKVDFCQQRAPGGFAVWRDPFVCTRTTDFFNLRMDPYERANIVSDQYYDWLVHNVYLGVKAQVLAQEFIATFKDYPPSQPPASFTIDPDAIVNAAKEAAEKKKK
jgi:arylsulfatase